MPLISDFIEKALIENISKSSNVSENRRRKLKRRAMVFLQPGMYLTKQLSDSEESKDNVPFNLSSIDNRVDESDAHSSSICFSGNDNNSFRDVQYVSSTSEHTINYFDSKNITGIDNRFEDVSLNKRDDANNISQDSGLSLLDILSSMQKGEGTSNIMSPPSMSTSTAGLINTSDNITIVGSTQTFVGRTSDDSLETTIEPRSFNGRLTGYFCSNIVFNLSNKVLSDTKIDALGRIRVYAYTFIY